ncbi:conserved hypothetical protein [delta proteobacterium NaphS2]|nr:conserved hypothetical protein [delta proteobacterium NaphS2]
MKKLFCAVVFSLCLLVSGLAFAGVPGILDITPAATLIVPFFEVGINDTTNPEDTLLIVYNRSASNSRIHYHVWDIHGNATDLYGDVLLAGNETWSATMRGLIAVSTGDVKEDLDDGGTYYHGFVTIDKTTAETTKNPTESGYPFATGTSSDSLEGFIYYVRLAEGSSNSMSMLPINWVDTATANSYLWGFYLNSDEREEFNAASMVCARRQASDSGGCSNVTTMSRVDSRIFLDPTYNAATRIILFTWRTDVIGGPSIYCDTHACESEYDYKQYDKAGSLVADTTIRLPNVVNIIDVSGSTNGLVSIQNIADSGNKYNTYGFSITNANPPSGASQNWDAIIPSYLVPD